MNARPDRVAALSVPAISELLADVFPTGVIAVEQRGPADPGLLYAPEAKLCADFSTKREAEFAAGRLCARRALAELGVRDFPLLVNADRTARWPDSVVGSITHTDGFCGAAVAKREVSKAIGVDAEVVERVTRDIWPLILTPAESALQSASPDNEKDTFAAIIFSAKEAFYKCQFPISGAWLDFEDVEVVLVRDGSHRGSFSVSRSTTTTARFPSERFSGRFRIDGKLVVAGVTCR